MDKNRNLTGIIIGILLIVAGILSLSGRFFPFIDWDSLWPLIIIGVGAVFFVVMALGDRTRGGLAVPGSILVTIGLILLVMNSTGRWEAWSYAWALIICAAGLGTLIHGAWSGQPELRSRGLKTLRDGLILFLIVGLIMEFIFSLGDESRWGSLLLWAVLLALLGLVLLVTRLLQLGKADGKEVDLFWPVLMIGAGLLTILAEIGWLPIENLWTLANLWPLLLIAAGVGLLFRGRSAWLGFILGLAVVAILFFVVFAGGALGLPAAPTWSTGLFRFGDTAGERITGSGNVIREERPVSGFDGVELGIPANLVIEQGAGEALTIAGDDNILPYLITEVSGGTLTIREKAGMDIRPSRTIQIQLAVKDLKELQNSSSGEVTAGPLTTGNFHLKLSSSGDIKINGIQADTVTAELSSSGNITIQGRADQLDVRVSSSGSFQAGDLQVRDARVRISSSGDVMVWAVEGLNVNISSSGDVEYYGSPEIKSSITSSGRLRARGEK